jgi:hypothetical protein
MRPQWIVVCVIAIASLTASSSPAGSEKRADSSGTDQDFKDKILYVVTKPKDAKGDCGYGLFEKVRVVRLGDRSFLVGQIPDYGDVPGYKEAAGKTVWTPVSEIVQITEFKNITDAKQYFEKARKAVEAAEKPCD